MNTETTIDLAADLAASQQLLEESNARIATLTTERDEAIARLQSDSPETLAVVTAERDSLRAENTRLQAQVGDFNRKLAAHLCRFGIRHDAVEQKAEGANPNLTEMCLAAKAGK